VYVVMLTSGCIMEPPADTEYAVLPVAVAMINLHTRAAVKQYVHTHIHTRALFHSPVSLYCGDEFVIAITINAR